MNARFQIAVHILTLLDHAAGELLSSDYIAGSLNTNPALVRKEISNLRKHGFIESKEGKGGGYALGKPAAQVSLADIYATVKPSSVLGQSKNDPNPACPIGKQINERIAHVSADLDDAIMSKLATISLEKFSRAFD